jgi:hypothetical protein
MKKMFILALLVPFFVFGYENFNGVSDTLRITDTVAVDSIRYTSAFYLSDYLGAFERLRTVVLASDTSSDGFASDSLHFIWGIQTGSFVLDSTFSTIDTAWDDTITVDTFNIDSISTGDMAKVGTDGKITFTRRDQGVDTTYIPGLAYQSREYQPRWDELARYWVKGISGQKSSTPILLMFHNKFPLYKKTRSW